MVHGTTVPAASRCRCKGGESNRGVRIHLIYAPVLSSKFQEGFGGALICDLRSTGTGGSTQILVLHQDNYIIYEIIITACTGPAEGDTSATVRDTSATVHTRFKTSCRLPEVKQTQLQGWSHLRFAAMIADPP